MPSPSEDAQVGLVPAEIIGHWIDMNPLDFDLSDFKTFETLFVLNSFGKYWKENEQMIQRASEEEEARSGPNWDPKTQADYAEFDAERKAVRYLYDEIMTPTFRYSCVVMLCVIVERAMLRLIRDLERMDGPQSQRFNCKPGSFLEQANTHCKKYFNLDIKKCPECDAVYDLQWIRNCIVHCHGEVDLVSGKTRRVYLSSLHARRPGFIANEGGRIEIGPECIDHFLKEIWSFFIWVFGQLKWEIHDFGQAEKLC